MKQPPITIRKNSRRFQRGLLAGGLLLQLLLAGRGFALDPARDLLQYNCQTWSRQNGLPADKINSVIQTRDGYIWLGTENGLVRFDGMEFKAIPIDLPQVKGQDISKLYPAKNGGLDFVINNGGYGGYGGYDGKHFSRIGDDRWQQPSFTATMIMEARDGAIWTAAGSAVGRWSETDPGGSFFTTADIGTVLSLCEDPAGRVWLGTSEHGLYYWADGKFVQIQDESLRRQNIFALAGDAENRLWIGTENGLGCYVNGQVINVPEFSTEVRALLVDSHGILWLGTSGSGLGRYENGKLEFLTKAGGLGSDYVSSLAEDAEGSIWVGTRDGLRQLSDLKFPIYTSHEGIGKGASHSVAASKTGGLWIATDTGISFMNGEIITNYTSESLFANRYIKMVFEARNGDVYAEDGDKNINVISGGKLLDRIKCQDWVSAFIEDAKSIVVSMGSGNAIFRIQDGKLNHYEYKDGLPPDYFWINSMCVAKDEAIWVASKNGIFRLHDGTVKHWSTAEGLSGATALWINEDSDGSIWAGLATGIARIKNGQIKNITMQNGLADNWIYAIVPDGFGYFWCDSSRGIFRVSQQNLNDFADGKAARIECKLFDGQESVKSTGRSEDLGNAGCKTLDGRIWFACPWGVVMVDPAHIPTNTIAPPVHIEHLFANGREITQLDGIVVPPGKGELEFHYNALTFIAPQKVRFRYRLEGYDKDWVEAGDRRSVFYTNLKPGRYTFRVIAANADGVWNQTGDALKLELRPHFYQTLWFYLLCGGLASAALAGIYLWRGRCLTLKQQALQKTREALEAEVLHRTADLAKANDSLRHEIEERKRMQLEIERVHQQLLETSRQAGMAEIATNVLHNIGNVLNSVNISVSLVADGVKKARAASLVKVVDLLREHEPDIGTFFTSDPRGRQLPGYLSQLTEHFLNEQKANLRELGLLQGNIDHIKEIVAMQQSYAKVSGLKEVINLNELVEDCLRMNDGAMSRHQVKVVREFGVLPPMTVEKHKILQVLVNLVRNAKHACQDSLLSGRKLTVRTRHEAGLVKISVMDNGVGIPPENLIRIFNHGFTTRKDGHGFGLHSGALAAREMGGSLTVFSAGSGQGAIFTLELPGPDEGAHI